MINTDATESYEMVTFADVIEDHRNEMVCNARRLVGAADADIVVEIAIICARRDWDHFQPDDDEDFDLAAATWLHVIITAEARSYMKLHRPAEYAVQGSIRRHLRRQWRMSRLSQIELAEIACSDSDSIADSCDSTMN